MTEDSAKRSVMGLDNVAVFRSVPSAGKKRVSVCRSMSLVAIKPKVSLDEEVTNTNIPQQPDVSPTIVVKPPSPPLNDTRIRSKHMQLLDNHKYYSSLRSEMLPMARLVDLAKVESRHHSKCDVTQPTGFGGGSAEDVPTQSLFVDHSCCISDGCPCNTQTQEGTVPIDLRFRAQASHVAVITNTDNWRSRSMNASPTDHHIWTLRICHSLFQPLLFKFVVDGIEFLSPEYKTLLTDHHHVSNVIVPAAFEFLTANDDEKVFLVAEFDGWRKHPMKYCSHRNRFICKLALPRPGMYHFKFLVNGISQVSELYEIIQLGDSRVNHLRIQGRAPPFPKKLEAS
eukprot:c6617_g1_i1.p1 GENE.c6617_g1_i1~~c6617_g1_i1.p1  ORF type:complete len:341 (+),score=55.81 c6617_g1_i1:33-1055(+)